MAKHKKKYSSVTDFSQRQSNQKVIQYKATSGFIFQIVVKSQVLGLQVSISVLITYPLTLTPYSVATIDGITYVDNACALLPDLNECALIQDGNSSFYMTDVPRTMKTISRRIFGCLPGAAETSFSTDSYVDRLHSPKSAERDRRGCDEKFIVEGMNFHRPVD